MNIFPLALITIIFLNTTMFSLQILCPLPFGGSLPLYSSLGNVFFRFVDRSVHHLSAYPIRHLPKPLVSCDGQGNTIQESSSHKCNQEVWWDALNVGAATTPSVMLVLTPLRSFFSTVGPPLVMCH